MPDNMQKNHWPEWETVRLIGRGSFGSVYEIQRDVFGEVEKAALKVISIPQNDSDIDEMYSEGYDDESITSTFQSHLKSITAEYSLMRKMNGSANVVNCDDIRIIPHKGSVGWDIYIKMELLTPLAKALPEKVSEETVIQIAKDMCAALELCKKHEIVHRDIKPQNIFISPNGDYKLGDFGIAKTVEKTMGGTKIGTYKYMAPEVYNNQPYGHSADLYSLGLVLYWLLNERRMPFMPMPPAKMLAGMDEEARRRRLAGEDLPTPLNGSEELKRIVLKACAYRPKDRYESAAAMLDELGQLSIHIKKVHSVVSAAPQEDSWQMDTLHPRYTEDSPVIDTGETAPPPSYLNFVTPEKGYVCPKCGREAAPNTKFCATCGIRFADKVKGCACPYCGKETVPNAKFCNICGTSLTVGPVPVGRSYKWTCPHCGKETVPNAKFCTICGTCLSAGKSPSANDKLRSILFGDWGDRE